MTEKTPEEREQRIKELENLVVEFQLSNEKWRSLVEDTPNIIIVLDRDETIQFVNRTVAGVTVDEAIGKKIFDYMETDHQDEIRHVIKQVYETGVPGTYEIRGLGPEGSVSWYETRVGPLKSGGQVVGVTLMAVDITDRKKAEDAHRKSEEKYRNLVETTNDWVWEVNADAVYTYASPKVRDLLGYAPEEIVGKKVFDLMPPDEAARAEKIFQDSADTHGTFYREEGIRLHKDGRPVVLETNGVPILDRNGKLLGYRGIDRDITARKKMEEKLQWSENFLKRTQKLARMGSFEWDVVNNRAEMSDELYEIYGLTPGKFGHDDLLAQIKAIGNLDWAVSEQYASLGGRQKHHDELDRKITEWTAGLDAEKVVSRVRAMGIPVAEVLRGNKMHDDPHLAARNFYEELSHPRSGTRRYPGWPMRWSVVMIHRIHGAASSKVVELSLYFLN